MGITNGDIVENLSDGSTGVIDSVSSNELTVKSLTGGVNNVFANGDSYQIRVNVGMTTTADDDVDGELTLIDAARVRVRPRLGRG